MSIASIKGGVDKDSDLDYYIDWSDWLSNGVSITNSTWSVTSGDPNLVILHSDSIESSITTTFIAFNNASEGDEFTITNSIETGTTPPQKEDRSFIIQIVEK